jgi:hypothetical protein
MTKKNAWPEKWTNGHKYGSMHFSEMEGMGYRGEDGKCLLYSQENIRTSPWILMKERLEVQFFLGLLVNDIQRSELMNLTSRRTPTSHQT